MREMSRVEVGEERERENATTLCPGELRPREDEKDDPRSGEGAHP